jgi:tRNA A-37 threonylcarbamoyl transferase component Bud32/tetratricopeptide (TPR) repeat protein
VGCPNEVELLGYLRAGGAQHSELSDHVTACGSCEGLLVAFAELSASRGPASTIDESTPADDDRLPTPGELLGRYQLDSTLGRGAMGVVYLADDPKLDRRVALKLVLQRQRSSIEEARVLLEARAAARVQDPHLVGVYDVGAWNGRVFLAMEYVDGPTLTRWLAQGQRSVDAIVDVFVDVARGLVAAHQAGLVHCDVKPDNILIGSGGAKLGDFGLAVGPDHAGAIGLRGTPLYMAPELIRGAPPSAASDQFALCVSLLEAIAGARPDHPVDDRHPPSRPARMPRWLFRIVARGLSTDPARRFASVADVVAVLERHRHGRRRRGFLIGAAVAAAGTIAAAATFAWVLANRGSDQDPCPAPRAELAQVWNAERGRDLNAALGPSAGPRARQRLDAYGAAWIDASVSACRATRVDGRYSEAVLDRRTQCLVRARSRLGALVDLLRDRKASPSEHAVSAIDNLPELAACEDIAALAPAGPSAPALRAQLAIATSMLDVAMELIDLRRADAALAQLRASHASIVSVPTGTTGADGRRLEAEEHYLTGIALAQLERRDEAVEAFERAYQAARAAASERLEVTIALELAGMLDREPATRPTARTWLDRGRAVAERLDDTGLTALVAEREGSLAFASNDYAAAARAFRVAVDLRHGLHGDSDLRTALVRSSLASALNKTGMFDEARGEFRRAMTGLVAARGDAHPSLLTMWNGLGNLEMAVGNISAAREAFVEARRRAVLARGESHGTVIALDINLASIARRQGDLEQARAGYQRAVDALEKTGRRGSATWRAARQGLAQIALERRDFATGRPLIEALIAERLADKVPEPAALASLRIDLATALTGQGHGAEAEAELAAVRSAYVTAFGERHPKIARVDLQRAANAIASRDTARAERIAAPYMDRDDLPTDIRADARWLLAKLLAPTAPMRARQLATAAAQLARDAGDRTLADEITSWLAARQ